MRGAMLKLARLSRGGEREEFRNRNFQKRMTDERRLKTAAWVTDECV